MNDYPEDRIPKDSNGNRFVAGVFYEDPCVGFVYLACKTGRNSDPLNITLFLAGCPEHLRHQRGHRFNMGRLDLLRTFRPIDWRI